MLRKFLLFKPFLRKHSHYTLRQVLKYDWQLSGTVNNLVRESEADFTYSIPSTTLPSAGNVENNGEETDIETVMMEDIAVRDMMTVSSVNASLMMKTQALVQVFTMTMRRL
jgi:hypothetical protein